MCKNYINHIHREIIPDSSGGSNVITWVLKGSRRGQEKHERVELQKEFNVLLLL
jgi:hypothetical protein